MTRAVQQNRLQTGTVILLSVAASLALVTYVANHPLVVEAFVRHAGLAGPVVIVGLYALLGLSPVPSESLSMINGAIYGPVAGTAIGFTGNMASAMIEYYIGAGIRGATDFKQKKQHLPFGLGRFPADSVWFLLIARIVPGFGGKMVSVIAGMYHVPMGRYLWTAAIPTLIGTALFVLGGHGLMNIF